MMTTTNHQRLSSPGRPAARFSAIAGAAAASSRRRPASRGFTLIELIVVLAIITTMAMISVPRVSSFMAEAKAPTVAGEFQRAMTRIRTVSTGATPYATVNTAMLANNLRETSFTVVGTGTAATVTHSLGASGATVTAAPASLVALGDAVAATWQRTNVGACAVLPSLLNAQVEAIQVNGTAVKTFGGSLDAVAVQNQCTAGDTNTLVFTFR